MDLISVVIPTYNRANLIGRAIKSVLEQTYENFEIIVVDDASTDGTEKMVRSLNSPKIIYLRHKENKGVSAARNTGIKHAKGRYVAFLDSDDEFIKDKLAIQNEYFLKLNPPPAIIYTNLWIEENGKLNLVTSDKYPSQYVKIGPKHFPTNAPLPSEQTWMVDINCLEKIGGFDEELRICEGGDLFARIVKSYPAYYINLPLAIMHITEGHLFSLNGLGMDFIKAKEIFLRKNFDWLSKDKIALIKFYSDMGDALIKLNRKDLARPYYLKIVKRVPMKISSLRKFFQTFF
jgi:glycosyltransferase involved in cell wall biosynthesis